MVIIRKTLEDLQNFRPNQAEVEILQALKDEDIDFTEMPKLDKNFWEKAMTPAQFRAYRKRLKASETSS